MPYDIEDQDDASTAESVITVKVICNQRPTARNDPDNETDEDDELPIPVTR